MPATAKPNPTPTRGELAECAARKIADASFARDDAFYDAYARSRLYSDGTGPKVRLSRDGSRIIVEDIV